MGERAGTATAKPTTSTKGLGLSSNLAVSATGLVKRFGDRRVVDGVDIAVPKGLIYGVLGPNGAGKTTTLRMLLGIIEPDEGQRMLLGRNHPREASDVVGYLPEERGLYPSMKCREAIAFLGALRGLPWSVGRKRAGELLEGAGLGHAADDRIRKLSKGMAQLVQLLGSVVHEPDLLVLDEPFSGLDPVNQEKLEALLVKLIDAGHGISGLSIERPGLHDAFVRIVGAEALAAAEAEALQ